MSPGCLAMSVWCVCACVADQSLASWRKVRSDGVVLTAPSCISCVGLAGGPRGAYPISPWGTGSAGSGRAVGFAGIRGQPLLTSESAAGFGPGSGVVAKLAADSVVARSCMCVGGLGWMVVRLVCCPRLFRVRNHRRGPQVPASVVSRLAARPPVTVF